MAGILASEPSSLRLVGAVPPGANDGRQPQHRCMRLAARAGLAAPDAESEALGLPPKAA